MLLSIVGAFVKMNEASPYILTLILVQVGIMGSVHGFILKARSHQNIYYYCIVLIDQYSIEYCTLGSVTAIASRQH